MAKLTTKEITALGREFVLSRPDGARFTEIVNHIMSLHPDAVKNTVSTQIGDALVSTYPAEIGKPSRGLYVPILQDGALTTGTVPQVLPTPAPPLHREEDFYDAFAAYLQDDLDEATGAKPMGGAGFKDKWGTPDVVGVYRPHRSDLIPFTPEIIAAEIKGDPYQSVVAFGQAVAYRLFASKSYIVMPSTLSQADQSRLDALCLLFGIGFVLFDTADITQPRFQIRVRAMRFNPDTFYVNEFARRLHETYPDRFNALFP
jgi:hypothetical protein